MSAIKSNNVSYTLCLRDTCTETYLHFGKAKNHKGAFQDALLNLKNVHEFVVASSDVNFYALYQIQLGKAKALRELGMIKENNDLGARNYVINDNIEWGRVEIES